MGFAYDSGLLEAKERARQRERREKKRQTRLARRRYTPDISLFEKRMRYLFIRETARRDGSLFAKRMLRPFMYSRNGYGTRKREGGELEMKTGNVRKESYPLRPNPTSKYANAHTHLYPFTLICTIVK